MRYNPKHNYKRFFHVLEHPWNVIKRVRKSQAQQDLYKLVNLQCSSWETVRRAEQTKHTYVGQ